MIMARLRFSVNRVFDFTDGALPMALFSSTTTTLERQEHKLFCNIVSAQPHWPHVPFVLPLLVLNHLGSFMHSGSPHHTSQFCRLSEKQLSTAEALTGEQTDALSGPVSATHMRSPYQNHHHSETRDCGAQVLTHLCTQPILCPGRCSHCSLQSNHVCTKARWLLTTRASIVDVQRFVTVDKVVAPDNRVPATSNHDAHLGIDHSVAFD